MFMILLQLLNHLEGTGAPPAQKERIENLQRVIIDQSHVGKWLHQTHPKKIWMDFGLTYTDSKACFPAFKRTPVSLATRKAIFFLKNTFFHAIN